MLALTFLPVGKAQGSGANDIELLKAKLAEQQKQIEVLRQSVDAQQKLIERLTTPAARPAEQAASQPAAQASGFTRAGGAVASATGALPWLRAPSIRCRIPRRARQPVPRCKSRSAM
jgi:uncharacterized coiled-coil protein SlyX